MLLVSADVRQWWFRALFQNNNLTLSVFLDVVRHGAMPPAGKSLESTTVHHDGICCFPICDLDDPGAGYAVNHQHARLFRTTAASLLSKNVLYQFVQQPLRDIVDRCGVILPDMTAIKAGRFACLMCYVEDQQRHASFRRQSAGVH
jgi:hypothetical protein